MRRKKIGPHQEWWGFFVSLQWLATVLYSYCGFMTKIVKRTATKAANELPIDEQISLHRKGWVIQRIGWGLMFAFLIAAALGVFGEGPLSKRKVQAGNISIQYERFGRYEHGMLLRFQSGRETITTVSIPQDYLKTFRVDKIVPEPQKEIASGGGVRFQFEGAENTVVTFYVMPVERSSVTAVIKVNSDSFSIKQTIYP